jgi:DNA adenine methylase
VLSDTNPELIDTYSTLRESPEKVWQILRRHQNKHSNAYYYKIRASKPRTPASKAARFIYLNRTCFNGLYRVNLRGEFNVPKGTKDNVIFPDDNFPAISAALQGVNMYVQDFAETIRSAQQGDFVFVDPPYTVQHNNNNFIKYNEKLFTWADQERLSEGLALACKRGALVLLTNADNKCIRKLYSSRIWAQFHVNRNVSMKMRHLY